MMKVQKGQVKYKDRSDIICTYGIAEDGKQYYFLDDEKLGNGNLIASTALVEAIDSLVIASNIGVISEDGRIVVPFKNKSIKPIFNRALLVEKASPTTQSVIDSVNMRKDPLSAAKLVTTPATIKDRMNAKMGLGGRFVFNDQFSEATVVDLDGNNLINDEYYSFIGINHDILYMSKNTIDSKIVECSIGDNRTTEEKTGEILDVAEATIEKDVIDQAMKVDEPVVSTPIIPSVPATEADVEDKEDSNWNDDMFHPINFQEIEIDKSDALEGVVEEKEIEVSDKPEKETRVSLFEGLTFNAKEDSEQIGLSSIKEEDSIIEDTAETLSKLIKKNREQRRTILNYEEKMDDLVSFKKQAFNETQKLVRDNDDLKMRVEELEDKLAIANEKVEKLNLQLIGKDDLAKLLVDAKDLLDE